MTNPGMMNGRGGSCGYGARTGNCRSDGYPRRGGGTCGCGMRRNDSHTGCCEHGGAENGCHSLRAQLRRLEFSIVDVALYLDAYPDCGEALAYYHKLKCERDALRKEIEATCGPMTIYENGSETSWDWVDGPWPWHPDAD